MMALALPPSRLREAGKHAPATVAGAKHVIEGVGVDNGFRERCGNVVGHAGHVRGQMHRQLVHGGLREGGQLGFELGANPRPDTVRWRGRPVAPGPGPTRAGRPQRSGCLKHAAHHAMGTQNVFPRIPGREGRGEGK